MSLTRTVCEITAQNDLLEPGVLSGKDTSEGKNLFHLLRITGRKILHGRKGDSPLFVSAFHKNLRIIILENIAEYCHIGRTEYEKIKT